MSKDYSFLEEFLVPTLLAFGAYSTFKNMSQSALNAKMMNSMQRELGKCDPRNKRLALSIINRYSTQLTQIYAKKLDKKTLKKLAVAQNLIDTNFKRPLEQIINSPNPNWKKDMSVFLQKNVKRINQRQSNANMLSLAAIGTGAGIAAAGGTATAAGAALGKASLSLFGFNVIKSQFQHFNSMYYLNNMCKELEACNDNDRQTAINIIDKYCYQISQGLNSIVIKSGKKVPIDIQLELRTKLAKPLMDIINNKNNKYWKILVIDYVKSNKAQQSVQYVSNTLSQLIVPFAISKSIGR